MLIPQDSFVLLLSALFFLQLSKLTVSILKDFVNSLQLSSASQKKADLIDALNSHFGV